KLPHNLVASFRATLEEAREADVLLHVIDAAAPIWLEQKQVVDEVLAELDLADARTILVFNKIDQLTHREEEELRQRAAALYDERSVFVSAQAEGGLDPLREMLLQGVREGRPGVHLRIPATEGETIASVYRDGEVLQRDEDGATIGLVARLPIAILGRLRRREGVSVSGA